MLFKSVMRNYNTYIGEVSLFFCNFQVCQEKSVEKDL